MTKAENTKWLLKTGIIPVVRASSADEALKIVEAIYAGGIDVIEITMTVPGAIPLIATLADKFKGSVLLGAGTVVTTEAAEGAIKAGAEFILSPNLNTDVVEVTKSADKISVPAGLTPSEVVAAWQEGADFVKIFPCGNVGGASYLKALKAPFPDIPMIPTGGVSTTTIHDFFDAGASAVGVGGDLVDKKAIAEGKWDVITEKARQFVAAMKR